MGGQLKRNGIKPFLVTIEVGLNQRLDLFCGRHCLLPLDSDI
jgi:hypothetical protein